MLHYLIMYTKNGIATLRFVATDMSEDEFENLSSAAIAQALGISYSESDPDQTFKIFNTDYIDEPILWKKDFYNE